jgi:hypothetical protein
MRYARGCRVGWICLFRTQLQEEGELGTNHATASPILVPEFSWVDLGLQGSPRILGWSPDVCHKDIVSYMFLLVVYRGILLQIID